MSKRKGKTDAADAPLEAAAGAQEPAVDAAAGQAGEAATGTGEAGPAVAADAEAGGQVQGTPDPVADAIDAQGDEPEEAVNGKESGQDDDADQEPAAPGQRDRDGEAGEGPSPVDGAAAENKPGDTAFVAVEFGKDALVARLANGHELVVLYDDVPWLADANDAWRRKVKIEPDRLGWGEEFTNGMPVYVLTLEDIYGLGRGTRDEGDHAHAPAAGEEGADSHAADALAYTVAGMDFGSGDRQWPRWDDNVLAAVFAGSHAFGPHETAQSWIGWNVDDDDANTLAFMKLCDAAAGFLRKNRDAQPETIVIHLRRSGWPAMIEAKGRAAVAWRVFSFTLAQLDALDAAETAAKAEAEKAAIAARGPAPVRREHATFAPPDRNPLTQVGRRLQRR